MGLILRADNNIFRAEPSVYDISQAFSGGNFLDGWDVGWITGWEDVSRRVGGVSNEEVLTFVEIEI